MYTLNGMSFHCWTHINTQDMHISYNMGNLVIPANLSAHLISCFILMLNKGLLFNVRNNWKMDSNCYLWMLTSRINPTIIYKISRQHFAHIHIHRLPRVDGVISDDDSEKSAVFSVNHITSRGKSYSVYRRQHWVALSIHKPLTCVREHPATMSMPRIAFHSS